LKYRKKLRFKVVNYVAAGTVLWIVDPEAKEVEVYAPGKQAKLFRKNDTLDGGDVLPGFSLKVDPIFQ
jgi:Uma2 family endonuclease